MIKKWYLVLETKKGKVVFPEKGFKTKREAMKQAELARTIPVHTSVEIVKQ